MGEITRVQRAVYVDLPEAKTWSKCEKELIQDGVLKNESNAERLANLRKPVLLKGYKAEQHG